MSEDAPSCSGETKLCVHCHKPCPIDDFPIRSDTGKRRGTCRRCHRSQVSACDKRHRAERQKYHQDWRDKNRDKWNDYSRKHNKTEARKQYVREWRKQNPERCKRYTDRYEKKKKRSVRKRVNSEPLREGLIRDFTIFGLSVPRLAAKYKISDSVIYAAFRRWGVPLAHQKLEHGPMAVSWMEECRLATQGAGGIWRDTGHSRGFRRRDVTTFDIWVSKYGLEEAERRYAAMRAKMSEHKREKNNWQYGKPPTVGSSNWGYTGWYCGHYFRSMRELTFMIQCDRTGVEWKSAEHLCIPYQYGGGSWNYHPDFLVGVRLIEIKPQRWHKAPEIQAKARAAMAYCAKNGLTYELLDVEPDTTIIQEELDKGTVAFARDCRVRFIAYSENRRSRVA